MRIPEGNTREAHIAIASEEVAGEEGVLQLAMVTGNADDT